MQQPLTSSTLPSSSHHPAEQPTSASKNIAIRQDELIKVHKIEDSSKRATENVQILIEENDKQQAQCEVLYKELACAIESKRKTEHALDNVKDE